MVIEVSPHLLGRIPPTDYTHLDKYPFAVQAAPSFTIEKEIKRPTLDVYDQGQTPECVAFSTSKVVNWFNKEAFDAPWLYAQCKKVDGMPNEDGTNAKAACDVLRSIGHLRKIHGEDVKAGPQKSHGIASNHWAQSVDEIRAVFANAKPQPVLIGIDWYEAWFNPQKKNGEYWLQLVQNAGGVAGGHEIGIWAVSDERQAFGLSNNWGAEWPDPIKKESLVWLPYETMTYLLVQGADACVITDLPTR